MGDIKEKALKAVKDLEIYENRSHHGVNKVTGKRY